MFKEEFDGKTCLVTGGAGFIGSSLVEELIANGAIVKIIDNLSVTKEHVDFLSNLGADIFEKDISHYEEIEKLFQNIDYVFHLAAMNRAQRSINDPIKSNDINVPTNILLENSWFGNIKRPKNKPNNIDIIALFSLNFF